MSTRDEALRALWRARPRSRLVRFSLAAVAVLVAYSWIGVVEPAELFSAHRLANLERFLGQDARPHPLREEGFSWSGLASWIWQVLSGGGLAAAWATLWIAVLAIVLSGVLGLVLAPLAAASLATREPYLVRSEGRTRGDGHWVLLSRSVRGLCIFLRAIPEYVWAFLLLAMLRQSAWPAVLALAIHNSGILGRLGADTVENLDQAPLRALRMLGARRRDLALYAVLPLALPRFLLYFFYRFETCVREATVLGMLGIASLGFAISDARARQHYDEMLLLVALGAVIVLVADLVSQLARGWVRRGA